MNNKKFMEIVKDAIERYPEQTELHAAMRLTFIKRMVILEEYERKERKRIFFGYIQLIILVLLVLAIVLL